MGEASADVDAYDMAMLNRLPLLVIMYFLNFVTAEHYSIRLEKQLSTDLRQQSPRALFLQHR